MTNYERLGLYPHNIRASEEVKEAFESNQDIVSIVHATGTGKSYNALALAMDNKDKRIIWVVPTNAIKEHIEKTINDNPLLSMQEHFPNLEIITYSSLVNKTKDELKNIPCDLLIIDELHHLGAPVWGQRVNDIIDTHEDLKVFGMTAYTVRDRGTVYERDMVNPETDEIFSDSVVSNFDLYDALIEGVLPKPVVRSVITEDNEIIKEIRENIELLKKKGNPKYQEYEQMLNDTVKLIHKQPGVKELVQQSVKPGGKYIYFCPVTREEGINDIPTIQKKMMEYLQEKFPNQKIIFYSTTSKDEKLGRKNRDSFYHDVDLEGNNCQDAIRVMFAINQYNEGVHAPNIDGVFLGRTTGSDIVAFEQIGRALSVRGDNYQELEKYRQLPLEALRTIAISRGLPIKDNFTKEQIIDLLVSPLIIDLANNMEFIEELETNLGTHLKETRQSQSAGKKRVIKITDSSLNHQVINHNILEVLKKMRENLTAMTWDDKFNLLKAYYNHHSHSNVPQNFKTINGYEYDENGEALGRWVSKQRTAYKNHKLSPERIQKLSEVDFKYSVREADWHYNFKLLQSYYNHHGHSNVPHSFKTIDGYEYNENGDALGEWVSTQRTLYKNEKLFPERIQKLSEVEFKYSVQEEEIENRRNNQYKLLQIYYNHHGHSNVPHSFKTIDGYEYNENGEALGEWVSNQRRAYKNEKLSSERIQKLSEVEFKYSVREADWHYNFKLLQSYYNHHGHSNVPRNFKTINGYDHNENGEELGKWVSNQRIVYKNKKLSSERIQKLSEVDFKYSVQEEKFENQWNSQYELLQIYYNHHGHSNVPQKFKTINGYEEDENGEELGKWVSNQKTVYKNKKLLPERIVKLNLLGFRFSTKQEHDNKVKELCLQYGLNYQKHTILSNIPYQELYSKIAFLLENQIPLEINGELNPIFGMSNENMKVIHGISKEELISNYYINNQNRER